MNELFLDRIKEYIPDEFDDYVKSLDSDLYRGLRVNTKKISVEKLQEEMHLHSPSLFSSDSFYVDSPLGNHPYHICGAFYLQEPSASAPVTVLDVQPEDVVLDLCAAPGSKSTQIASKLDGGFLLSNEIDLKRSKILLSNMERMGVMNFMVTNTSPDKLCPKLPECFDKILVDAPCSGEGMMKKHDIAKDNWSLQNVLFCAKRQKDILKEAYKSLKKDGYLVYSTCTYAKEENEDVVSWFLNEYPDMQLVDIDVSFGREGFIQGVRRIFPMDGGEGQFIAKFHKTGGSIKKLPTIKSMSLPLEAKKFIKSQIQDVSLNYYIENDKVYGMSSSFLKLKNIPVLRQGVYIGDVVKNRFEPAHAFYMCSEFDFLNRVNVTHDEMDRFMHGLEIDCSSKKGYVAVCFEGICFGYGKSDGTRIKNKIPKGLRLFEGSHIL